MAYSIVEQLKSECAYYKMVLERTNGKVSRERTEAYGILRNNQVRIARYTIAEALEGKGMDDVEASEMADRIYYKYVHNKMTSDECLQLILSYIEMVEDKDMLLVLEEVLEEVFARL